MSSATDLGVLLVEDEDAIREPLARGLAREGYHVITATDGPEALQLGGDPNISVVLLDIGLPGLDGLEVCRRLRSLRPRLQILLLTARAEEVDAVDGLDAGADDYIAKPFRVAELLARVRSAGRRIDPVRLEVLGISLDPGTRQAYVDGAEVALSPKEFDLLQAMMVNSGNVVTRAQLLRDVWKTTWTTDARTLDQHVMTLRAKVGKDRILTVRGVGFRLGAPSA